VREPAGALDRPLVGAAAGSGMGRTLGDHGPCRLLARGAGDPHLGGCPRVRPGHAVHPLPAALLPAAEQAAPRQLGTDRSEPAGATEGARPGCRSRAAALSVVTAVLSRRRSAQPDGDPDICVATLRGPSGADADPRRSVTRESGLPESLERRQLVAHGDLLPGIRSAEHVLDGVRRRTAAPAPDGRAAGAPLRLRAGERPGVRQPRGARALDLCEYSWSAVGTRGRRNPAQRLRDGPLARLAPEPRGPPGGLRLSLLTSGP